MIEVLKQMVEALEWCHGGEPIGTAEAIKAGKQAIAELESQEPVAYIRRNEYNEYRLEPTDNFKIEDIPVSVEVMLYAHPPQRTWQGLTDEDIEEGIRQSWVTEQAFQSAAWWADAKLKEKNT